MAVLPGTSRRGRSPIYDRQTGGARCAEPWSSIVRFFHLGNSHPVECACRCCILKREPAAAEEDLDVRTGLVRHYPVSELENAVCDAILRAVVLETYWFGRDVIAAGYNLHAAERFEDMAVTAPDGKQFALEDWLAADGFELQFATGLRALADSDEALAHRCVALLERIPAGTGNAFCLR